MSNNLPVTIGLLWDEAEIRGELICDFHVQCWTDCNRWMDLPQVAGPFTARAAAGDRETPRYGIRLAESLSREHAEAVLAQVQDLAANEELMILDAGRVWQTANGALDNRVWWPVVAVNSPEHEENVLEILRGKAGLNPLGFFRVMLSEAAASGMFEFTLGDFSARALRIVARPLNPESVFWLYDVPIGRGFHWERKERLEYRGELLLYQPHGRDLIAANRLPLETYLESAVGSEMRSDLPPAFSQAQAIAARSTVLATAGRHHRSDGFDLCNDDHCQCYQGTQREANAVIEPVRATSDKILTYKDQSPPTSVGDLVRGTGPRVVDARYAKSCGGVAERYENVWGQEDHPYFAVRPCGTFPLVDLTNEAQARDFLSITPPFTGGAGGGTTESPPTSVGGQEGGSSDVAAWCNPALYPYPEPWDKDPLFRWTFTYTTEELGTIFFEKTGQRIGKVRELKVVKRGPSGRILILTVAGDVRTVTLYGELNIRRALSRSHLPSSYFVFDMDGETITLTGGGWGHGVGLCQLGAVAMAKDGKSLEAILEHYYPGSDLVNL